MGSGFQVLDFRFLVNETWIPDSIPLWYSGFLSCITDSKAEDSGFQKLKFPGFQNPDLNLRRVGRATTIQ